MTTEQLEATRAEHWRQNGRPLLTLDDAADWLQQTGLCLFLPRRLQLPAPAPSFVEACLGGANATPPRAAIEAATALAARLIAADQAVPLNLLGLPGEQPDFLVSPEALPYVFALRGDRDWKHDPPSTGAARVSPLVIEVWKALDRGGIQSAVEIRESLGRELTEAAVLRALHELWASMRVFPLPGENGEPAVWEPLRSRYLKAMHTGASASQVTALSVLLSLYLQSAVAATGEDAEVFLSPLASRSKVRDVVRGLSATRQISIYSLDARPLLYVEGTLPEFAEPVAAQAAGTSLQAEPAPGAAEAASEAAPVGEAPPLPGSTIRTYTRQPSAPDPLRWKRDSSVPPPPGQSRGPRPAAGSYRSERPSSGPGKGKSRGKFVPRREGSAGPRREAGAGPFREAGGGPRRPAAGAGKRVTGPRSEGAGSLKKGRWVPRTGAGDGRPAGNRPAGARFDRAGVRTDRSRPGTPGKARTFAGPSGRFSPRPRPEGAEQRGPGQKRGGWRGSESGARTGSGRPFGRVDGDRETRGPRPFTGRPTTGRPAAGRPATGKPAFGRGGPARPPFGKPPRKPFGGSRPFPGRPQEGRAGTGGRTEVRAEGQPSRPYKPFGGKPYAGKPTGGKPAGGKKYGSRPAGFKPRGSRPVGDRSAETRPAGTRPAGARPSGNRPFSGKPFGGKPFAGRKSGPGAGGRKNTGPRRGFGAAGGKDSARPAKFRPRTPDSPPRKRPE